MATRPLRLGSSRLSRVRLVAAGGAALIAIALLAPGAAVADPTAPQPDTVASVTVKLKQLSQQNEQLSEQLNLVIAQVRSDEQAVAQAEAQAAAAEAEYQTDRAQLTASLTAEYEGGSNFSRTGALLSSQSGQNFVDKLTTLSLLSVHRDAVLEEVNLAKTAAATAQAHAGELLAAANAQSASLKQQQASLAADGAKFQKLLAKLTAAQRAAYVSAGAPTASEIAAAVTVHAGTAGAAAAVQFALAQVHKRYVYDASGPSSYDCSGLTMAAYAHAGIALPHNAAAQYGYGVHVSATQLQPGDLVFLYRPISHVEIYIGGGLAVSAADPAEGVVIVDVFSDMGDYTGATRLT